MFAILSGNGYFAGYSHLLRPLICEDRMVIYPGIGDAEAQLRKIPGSQLVKVTFSPVTLEDREESNLLLNDGEAVAG